MGVSRTVRNPIKKWVATRVAQHPYYTERNTNTEMTGEKEKKSDPAHGLSTKHQKAWRTCRFLTIPQSARRRRNKRSFLHMMSRATYEAIRKEAFSTLTTAVVREHIKTPDFTTRWHTHGRVVENVTAIRSLQILRQRVHTPTAWQATTERGSKAPSFMCLYEGKGLYGKRRWRLPSCAQTDPPRAQCLSYTATGWSRGQKQQDPGAYGVIFIHPHHSQQKNREKRREKARRRNRLQRDLYTLQLPSLRLCVYKRSVRLCVYG